MTITEAKQALSTLPEKLSKRKRALAVTRGGKRVLAVMPWDDYEAIVETLEILSDERMMASIRRGRKQAEKGQLLSGNELRRALKL